MPPTWWHPRGRPQVPRTPPIIETPRLRLRGHAYDDLSDCVAMWSDAVVTQYIGGKPSTQAQTWARIQAYVGHWNLLGYGYWVIETRDTRHFMGRASQPSPYEPSSRGPTRIFRPAARFV